MAQEAEGRSDLRRTLPGARVTPCPAQQGPSVRSSPQPIAWGAVPSPCDRPGSGAGALECLGTWNTVRWPPRPGRSVPSLSCVVACTVCRVPDPYAWLRPAATGANGRMSCGTQSWGPGDECVQAWLRGRGGEAATALLWQRLQDPGPEVRCRCRRKSRFPARAGPAGLPGPAGQEGAAVGGPQGRRAVGCSGQGLVTQCAWPLCSTALPGDSGAPRGGAPARGWGSRGEAGWGNLGAGPPLGAMSVSVQTAHAARPRVPLLGSSRRCLPPDAPSLRRAHPGPPWPCADSRPLSVGPPGCPG